MNFDIKLMGNLINFNHLHLILILIKIILLSIQFIILQEIILSFIILKQYTEIFINYYFIVIDEFSKLTLLIKRPNYLYKFFLEFRNRK